MFNPRNTATLTATITLLALACGASPDDSKFSARPAPAGSTGGATPSLGSSEPDACDGFDNNGNGTVDEGCRCTPGQTQTCYPWKPGQADATRCHGGTQTCSGGGEFGQWGPCVGADLSCAPPGGPSGRGDGGASGPGGRPDAGSNGNGSPDAGGPPGAVDVPLFLLGDCITASCPPSAPYPVGCEVFFSPGDSRGCIASTPTSSVVYFQAGDQCDKGLITGTLHCSPTQGPALSAANCPINKPVPIYGPTRASCPATH